MDGELGRVLHICGSTRGIARLARTTELDNVISSARAGVHGSALASSGAGLGMVPLHALWHDTALGGVAHHLRLPHRLEMDQSNHKSMRTRITKQL